jgi:predicted thioesterase
MEFGNIKLGDSKIIQKRVTVKDAALNYGTGNLDNLFSTPSLVALAIEGACALIDENLPDGFITVGKIIHVDHKQPSNIGNTVSLQVTLHDIEVNKLTIGFKAFDELGEIGEGYLVRYIVNKDGLLNKAISR